MLLDNFPGTEAERREAERIFREYADVFSRKGEELGCTTTVQHRIHTEDDIPVNQRYRRIPPNQFEDAKEHLQVPLERGVIRPSQSDYASPIVLVRKKSEPFACAWTTAASTQRPGRMHTPCLG